MLASHNKIWGLVVRIEEKGSCVKTQVLFSSLSLVGTLIAFSLSHSGWLRSACLPCWCWSFQALLLCDGENSLVQEEKGQIKKKKCLNKYCQFTMHNQQKKETIESLNVFLPDILVEALYNPAYNMTDFKYHGEA